MNHLTGKYEGSCSLGGVLRCAGGFVAWVIGSGFATGQEVLQFFSSYGYASYAIIAINLVGFLAVGTMLLTTGRNKADEEGFEQFRYYCGRSWEPSTPG